MQEKTLEGWRSEQVWIRLGKVFPKMTKKFVSGHVLGWPEADQCRILYDTTNKWYLEYVAGGRVITPNYHRKYYALCDEHNTRHVTSDIWGEVDLRDLSPLTIWGMKEIFMSPEDVHPLWLIEQPQRSMCTRISRVIVTSKFKEFTCKHPPPPVLKGEEGCKKWIVLWYPGEGFPCSGSYPKNCIPITDGEAFAIPAVPGVEWEFYYHTGIESYTTLYRLGNNLETLAASNGQWVNHYSQQKIIDAADGLDAIRIYNSI